MSALEDAIRKSGQALHWNADRFAKTFTFDGDFIGFDGHFPHVPILPAIVQTMAGALAASEAVYASTGSHVFPTGISRAKFLKQIGPGDILTVTGTLNPKKSNITAAITILREEETAATFHVVLSGNN